MRRPFSAEVPAFRRANSKRATQEALRSRTAQRRYTTDAGWRCQGRADVQTVYVFTEACCANAKDKMAQSGDEPSKSGPPARHFTPRSMPFAAFGRPNVSLSQHSFFFAT